MDTTVRVRRARRDDLERVRSLLGADEPAPRAARKRYRRLVSTRREDLYVAERESDAGLVGLALVAYARGLGPPTAIVRRLLGSSDGAAQLLLERAQAHALARGCTRLELRLEKDAGGAADLAGTLLAAGWREGPRTLVRALAE